MTTAGDTFRALADLFDQPEVLARASLDVVRKQEGRIDRMDKRMQQLEALCRDLWLFACVTGSGGAEKAFKHRMNALGLLDGEQNDDEVRPLGCPFCGASTTDIAVANNFREIKVICLKCSAEFRLANHFRNEKQAVVHAWNTRNYHNWTGDVEVIGL